LRNFSELLIVFILVFSIDILAKDAFSFEPNEYPDSVTEYGMEPFFTGYRDSKPEDFVVVEGERWWHGTHSVAIHMTHEGARWLILTKNALESGENEALDTTFLDGVKHGDTLFYYLYIPWTAPIDSIFVFVRNTTWNHDIHTVYHASDLRYGRWNILKDGISDTTADGDPFELPLIQSDFQIDLVAGEVPACTLYIDAISSKGRVPDKYADTTGQSGIEMPEPGDGAVSVAKGSINCVEYAINVNAPVMVQVFDLTGRKQLDIPVGVQAAGSYSIDLSLPAGVYITRVTVGAEEVTGKAICVK